MKLPFRVRLGYEKFDNADPGSFVSAFMLALKY